MQSEIQLGDVFAAGAKLKVAWFRAQAVADPEVWNKGGGEIKSEVSEGSLSPSPYLKKIMQK